MPGTTVCLDGPSRRLPSDRRVLWGVGTPRTIRPHWALHELGLPYETRTTNPRTGQNLDPTFIKLNPLQKVPVLQDGDCVVCESAAIIAYLSQTYPSDHVKLVPTALLDRTRWMQWCFFIMTELDATSLYVIRRHRALKHIYGDAPAAVESAQAYFMTQLKSVDRALSAGPRYLMGDQFTTADILLTSCLVWAAAQEFSLYDSCTAYLQRTTGREAYRLAQAANQSALSRGQI
jgi:glutathione S-transferase